MEAAYRAARGERAVHVGPAGAVGDLTSPRKRLTTAAWWWEADESRAYDAVDRAMAEGEMARRDGGKDEVKAEGAPNSSAAYNSAAAAYRKAQAMFGKVQALLKQIEARNHEVPAFQQHRTRSTL
jgi:hypothetical protein